MDEYEVIYVDDDDERNAFTDHRRYGRWRPGRRRIVIPGSDRRTVRPGGQRVVRERVQVPAQVVVHQPPPPAGGIAGLSTGELVEIAAQLFAAIQPLPGAPTAQGHVETDVENLVTYQTALATHAKRDEQLRTLGGLLARLLK
jgi:hypothetical protein